MKWIISAMVTLIVIFLVVVFFWGIIAYPAVMVPVGITLQILVGVAIVAALCMAIKEAIFD